MKRTIRLFMWGYQQHFAWNLASLAEKVFKELGVALKPDVLLVGVLKPEEKDHHLVCVEPEDGKWPLSLFSDIPARYAETIKTHPLQNMFYGDEPSMRDKPENIRRDSARRVVQQSLQGLGRAEDTKSFCGAARPIGPYYVVPVIQVPKSLFQQFPPLNLPDTEDQFHPRGEQSLIHSCLGALLDEASQELLGPDPGRSLSGKMRTATEIVAEGAERFMQIPDLLTSGRNHGSGNLFQRLNIVSSLFYEGKKGLGSLILARPDNPCIQYVVRFRAPVPFREPRWTRKILEMTSPEIAMIVSDGAIHGLGRIKSDHDDAALDAFTVNFLDHYQWELCAGELVLMYSRYREPRLPQEPISRDHFRGNFLRIFSGASQTDADHVWALFTAGANMRHGSMIVVAEDAASEAIRLSDQGTPIRPAQMTPEVLERVSEIDGSILLDPTGVCHAIGVILDGEAVSEGSPARGSRFNSALRYVRSGNKQRMAIVVSDDRTVDIVPLLRPQIKIAEIAKHIAELEGASADTYHASQKWLDDHRFYLNQAQCDRVNGAIARLDGLPREVGELRWITSKFAPHPDLDDTYLLP